MPESGAKDTAKGKGHVPAIQNVLALGMLAAVPRASTLSPLLGWVLIARHPQSASISYPDDTISHPGGIGRVLDLGPGWQLDLGPNTTT